MQKMYETFRDNDRFPAYWEDKHINCMPHFHRSVEIVYVIEGTVLSLLNGKPCEVESGHLLMIPSYSAHSYYGNRTATSVILIVPLDFIPLDAPILSKKIFSESISTNAELNEEVLHCLRKILSLGSCDEANESLVKSYIYVILGLVIRSVGLTDVSEDSFLSQDVLLFLQNNYLRPVTLDSLARQFGYSKYRFSHIFNECVGCTLTQYVGSLRSRHAANLLRESDLPLMDIALNSGFDSMRTFYRSFKDCFGITPTGYRKSAVG